MLSLKNTEVAEAGESNTEPFFSGLNQKSTHSLFKVIYQTR